MKVKILSAIFWPALLAMIGTVSASAQFSTSLGDNLSLPLDNNLNGLDSAVAPGIVYEVAPGAMNLMTPDERLLPYDAIGASIVATPLNPSVTQLFVVSRVPFQLDGSVRDSTMLTGQFPRLPIDIVETLTRKAKNVEFGSLSPTMPASTFSTLPYRNALPSPSPLGMTPSGGPSILSRTAYPQSSWRAGSGNGIIAAPELDINPSRTQSTESSGTVSDSNSSSASLLLNKKRGDRSKMYVTGSVLSENRREADPSGSQLSQQPNDDNRSPLESKAVVMGTDSGAVTENPLESFGQKSRLNPDITLAARRRNSTRKNQPSLNTRAESSSWQTPSPFAAGTQLRQGRPSGSITAMREADVLHADVRRMKQSSNGLQANKSRWHNPILQQMESESAATSGIR